MSDDLTNKRTIKMLQDKAKDLPYAHIPQAVAELFAALAQDPNNDLVLTANCFMTTAIAALMSLDPEKTYHLTQNNLKLLGRAEALRRHGADAAQIAAAYSEGTLVVENQILCQQLRTILHGNDS